MNVSQVLNDPENRTFVARCLLAPKRRVWMYTRGSWRLVTGWLDAPIAMREAAYRRSWRPFLDPFCLAIERDERVIRGVLRVNRGAADALKRNPGAIFSSFSAPKQQCDQYLPFAARRPLER